MKRYAPVQFPVFTEKEAEPGNRLCQKLIAEETGANAGEEDNLTDFFLTPGDTIPIGYELVSYGASRATSLYEDLWGILNRRKPRETLIIRHCRSTCISRYPDNRLAYIYHNTAVLTAYEDGQVLVNNGGWNSQTTRNRINEFSQSIGGWHVSQRNYSWYFVNIYVNTPAIPYVNKAVITRQGWLTFPAR